MTKLEQWFAGQNWQVFSFQQQAWHAYLKGGSGLIHAPTGNGKSLAALGGPLLEALNEKQTTQAAPVRVLWITPLRALAADLEENLRNPVTALALAWTIERRTGDTSSAVRSRQRKRLPTLLITTPESLSLLLSYADTAAQLKQLHCVIVDEWHELLATKRGVQTELCLARLRKLSPQLRTWGLSATLGNLDQALAALLGPTRSGRVIAGEEPGSMTIRTLIPATIERFPWAGHLGLKLLPEVIETLATAATTLLFTNTRAQAELWYQALLVLRPDWEEDIALHHGSIDRRERQLIEDRLREGTIRCVVCTSSLDLGVDFSPVDQVIQVGSPKGIARLIQRAGRSGHQPGATSAVICVPTHAFELVEIAAVRQALAAARIEQRKPLELSLDVLVQHLVTLAVGGGFQTPEILDEIRSTYAYRHITEAEWRWTLDFVTCGGEALQHYPQYQKVVQKDNHYQVEAPRIARLHRMSVGTITSSSVMRVKFVKGGDLGHIEEAFIAKLKPRDSFLFAGRRLELARVRDMTAYVRLAKTRVSNTPRWSGSRLPISGELAAEMLAVMQQRQR
jgi:ATP-dependent Lhr-like helicase